MTSFAVVTSFHRDGYEAYGRRMIETFDRHWPREVPLLAYSEGFRPEAPSDRVRVVDLLGASDDLVAFRERHRANPRAHGWTDRRWRVVCQWRKLRIKVRRVRALDAYRWEAVRFSHKPFAIFDAAAKGQADVLIWLDADVMTRVDLPLAFLERAMPAAAMLSCIRRPKFTDCSVVGYNLRHPRTAGFLRAFRELYVTDALFRLPEYHDSYLFDAVRRRFERDGCLVHDLADGAGVEHGHVFDHCELGCYLDHLKGRRKPRVRLAPAAAPAPGAAPARAGVAAGE